MKKMGILYKVGVVTSFLALSGIAEAFTEHGNMSISIILFIAGFLMCLTEYIK